MRKVMAALAALALLGVFSGTALAKYPVADCRDLVLRSGEGTRVEVFGPAPDKGSISFDATDGVVDISKAGYFLASGDYLAVWSPTGEEERFTVTCPYDSSIGTAAVALPPTDTAPVPSRGDDHSALCGDDHSALMVAAGLLALAVGLGGLRRIRLRDKRIS